MALDLDHGLRRGGQRGLSVGALVGVGDADAAGELSAVGGVLGPCLQRARAAVWFCSPWPCVSCSKHEGDVDLGAVAGAVLGVGDGDLVGDLLAPVKEAALDRRGDGDHRRRVADGDDGRFGVGLAAGVGDGQLGREDAVGGVDVRRVGVDRVDGAVAVEVPRVLDRVARVGVARPLAGEAHAERRLAVGRRRVEDGLGGALALDVVEAVHARVGVLREEPVAVGQQVQRAVGTELQVHRRVALERLGVARGAEVAAVEQVVDLEDLLVRVEPDLAQRVLREFGEEDRVVVVGRELRRVRVARGVVVLRGAVRADAARVELREQLRAGAA